MTAPAPRRSRSQAAAPVWGRANLARVRQVLRALAQKALQHTPAGGQVVIDVASDGDWRA